MNEKLAQASQNLIDQLATLRVLAKGMPGVWDQRRSDFFAQLGELDATAEALHTMHVGDSVNPIKLYPKVSDEAIRTSAIEQWAEDGQVEIDADAVVSRSEDGGAYVAAWVWVELVGEGSSDEEDEDA
jgi:hypothetical protein